MAAPNPPLTSRLARLADGVPLVLVVIAEAAWTSVLVGLVQEWALQRPAFGLAAMLVVVAAGVVVARILAPRLDGRWPPVALALAIVAGAAGWLASADARGLALAGDLPAALARNPGGWFAAIALVRGYAHAGPEPDDGTVNRLLTFGIPGLAIASAVGGMIADPWRSEFLAETLRAAILFVSAGTLGLAFARLTAEGGSGVAWRRNPSWVALIGVLVATAIWAAIPGSLMTGVILSWLVALVLTPILILGVVATFQARNRRLVVIALFASAIIVGLGRLAKPGAPDVPLGAGSAVGVPVPPEALPPLVTVGLGGLGLLLLGLVILVLARLWMRQLVPVEAGIDETRTIDLGAAAAPTASRRRPRRGLFGSEPRDAVTAYLALLDGLRSSPSARRDAETPAEHARRVGRSASTKGAGVALPLLAADYVLARFGGRRLTAHEDARAIERWRRLRRELDPRPRQRRWATTAREILGPEEIENRY